MYMISNELGKVAFDAYNTAKGGVTYDGKPIPPWEELGHEVRLAWACAGGAVRTAVEAKAAIEQLVALKNK